jgi:hypothetical protein
MSSWDRTLGMKCDVCLGLARWRVVIPVPLTVGEYLDDPRAAVREVVSETYYTCGREHESLLRLRVRVREERHAA